MANQYLRRYMDALLSLEQEFDLEAVSQMIEQLKKARAERRRIFVFGNGGSASHANHIACDLGKNVTRGENGRFQILSICDNMSTVTAYANDVGFDCVFQEQLKNMDLLEGDVILAISASGNSPNVVNACTYAREKKAVILSMTGFSGGQLKKLSDVCLHVACNEYEKVEDLHMTAIHMLVSYFKKSEGAV